MIAQVVFAFNFWTFLLFIAFIGALAGGYYLIASQVKLVKKEVWTNLDRIKCFIYGFFFASGVIIIVAMMVSFTTAANYKNTGPFIYIPLIICLIFITLYPLVDFLYMASSQDELAMTPFQRIFEKYLINRFKKPFSYIIAVILYLVLIILPPILIIISGIPIIISWMSWAIILPMSIITFYGAKGYITGLANSYSQIPRLGRSAFLSFVPRRSLFLPSKARAYKEFLRDPMNRIMTGIMLFLYFWTAYSLVTSLQKIDPNLDAGGFNTMQYGFSVYIVLFLGIWGYFSRFWGRKIKFKTMDIMFAAFLIAAVGINVLINFILVNAQLLEISFSELPLTSDIIPSNAHLFALAAIIEEFVLVSVISYYFFERKQKFMGDTIFAVVTQSGDTFNAIPVWNLVRSKDKRQRNHAISTILTMYSRLPIKIGYDINDPIYKDSLFDALSDSNPYVVSTAKKIMVELISDYPKKAINLVIDALCDENYDKALQMTKILREKGQNILSIMPEYIFYQLISHPEYHISRYVIQILHMKYDLAKEEGDKPLISQENLAILLKYVNTSDYEKQAEILEIISEFGKSVPQNLFSERLNHHYPRIRSIAAESVGDIDLGDLSNAAISTLLSMLENTNPDIKSSVMEALGKIGNFQENNIPIEPFYDGLIDQNQKIRDAAVKGSISYLKEVPNGIKLYNILKLIKEQDVEIQLSLLQLIQHCWMQSPSESYPHILHFLRSESNELKKLASIILIEMGETIPEQMTTQLIVEPETTSFIRRGMISTTIIELGKKKPEAVLKITLEQLNNKDSSIRVNSASVLNALAEIYPDRIPLSHIIKIWVNEPSPKVKKQLSHIVGSLALIQSDKLKPLMPTLLKALDDPDSSVRINISKMFVEIGEKIPNLIPLSFIKKMVEDTDSYVRENGMKLIGLIETKDTKTIFQWLQTGLLDKEWNVKNAAAESIAQLGANIDNKEISDAIRKLTKDPAKWSRIKGIEICVQISERNSNFISVKEVIDLVKLPKAEENYLSNVAKLLGIVAVQDLDFAFPSIIDLMQSPSERIRQGMISGLVKLSVKIPASELVPRFLTYLSDETDIILQESIALLLKKIVKYEAASLKDRVISLLKIRCQMSQNKIICEVLSDLQN